MRKAAGRGFINATDCADYLTKKGMPFRDAYTCVGKLVHYCIEKGKTLETLELAEYKAVSEQFDQDVYAAIDLAACLNGRQTPGGPAPESVAKEIAQVRARLKEIREDG